MTEKIIQVLSLKEKARSRINVFHDSSSNWINLVKELIGNSLDVFDKTLHHITIDILSPTKLIYIDDGCGIPVETVASNGMPSYQAIFEVDFAGSRYGNSGATVGQNGVFFWTLAMTCEDIKIEVGRPNGKVYKVAYHKGDRVYDLQEVGTTDKTYTKVTFSPDSEVWTNVNYTFDEIDKICEAQASMENVEITLTGEDKEKKYYYENGIEDYFKEKMENKTLVSSIIKFDKVTSQLVEKMNKEFDINIDSVLAFSNDSNDDFKKDFLNTADLIKYGSIRDGLVNGLKNAINKYLKDNNMYDKKEKQITGEDVDTGLNYIANVKSNYVEYVSQSKQSTDAVHLKVAIQREISEFMKIYFIENPLEAKKIANQVLVNKRVREKADVSRANIKKKLLGNTNLFAKVEGLKDCDMRHSVLEERILILDEGLSANSTIINAFDNRYMGCIGLRGRFINALKSNVEDVLNNAPARAIIQALGCGIEIPQKELSKYKGIETFDIEKLRYGIIAILCDADSWGRGISLSLITFFKEFMPTLLKKGMVYLVASPRYEIIDKKKNVHYVYNETERDKKIKKLGNELVSVGIKKGLGEFNKEQFWEYVLSPEARKNTFHQVSYKGDEEEINKWFDTLMGEDIQGRKQFVRERIVEVDLDEMN